MSRAIKVAKRSKRLAKRKEVVPSPEAAVLLKEATKAARSRMKYVRIEQPRSFYSEKSRN
jgi:hypothetical protein